MLMTVNPRYVVGSVMVLLLVYWVPATLYTLVDIFRPAWLYKYKVITHLQLIPMRIKDSGKYQVQPSDSQCSLSSSALLNTIALVLFNQVNFHLNFH